MFMIGMAMFFLSMGIYNIANPGNPLDEPPNWFNFVMFLIFGLVSWLVLNFRQLEVCLTGQGIEVGYGQFRHRQQWLNIEGVTRDSKPGLKYGGFGIRLTWSGGKPVLVYNTIGAPAVELKLKQGRYSKRVFSTRRPEEVIGLINRHIG